MSSPRDILDRHLEQHRTGRHGDPWIDVMVEYANGNPEPITAYLRTMHRLMPWLYELDGIAGLLQFMHTKSQKRPRGKPGGEWLLWKKPDYVAAWFAEHWIANHKRTTGRRVIADELRESFINAAVYRINTWPFAKDDPASFERVWEILRGPRSRRLP
jgi:hypothetical protein